MKTDETHVDAYSLHEGSERMKRVNVRFEEEAKRCDIDVLFTASQMDDQVTALMSRVEDPLVVTWSVRNERGELVTLPEERIVSISVDNRKKWTMRLRCSPVRRTERSHVKFGWWNRQK